MMLRHPQSVRQDTLGSNLVKTGSAPTGIPGGRLGDPGFGGTGARVGDRSWEPGSRLRLGKRIGSFEAKTNWGQIDGLSAIRRLFLLFFNSSQTIRVDGRH